MVKVLKLIRNIIVTVILFVYLVIIISASVLLLSKNDYGTVVLGEKALVPISSNNVGEGFKQKDLVIVEEVEFEKIKENDTIFVYKTDTRDNSVVVKPSKVKKIDYKEEVVTIKDDTVWGKNYVAGKPKDVYKNKGVILQFVLSKWIFFTIFIIPCFLILVYEIYLLIITIKFDDDDEIIEKEELKETKTVDNTIYENQYQQQPVDIKKNSQSYQHIPVDNKVLDELFNRAISDDKENEN